jgi:hypothetical protein
MLSLLIVTAVFAATVTLSTGVAAAANVSAVEVTDDPVTPDGTIVVEGTLDATGEVTFLVQDPGDDDIATVTKNVQNTDFSVDIDLDSMDFGDGLDDGEARLSADTGSGFKSAEAQDTFVVDNEYPTVDIDSPDDGANLTGAPTISGTASDDAGLDTVEMSIQREDGKYYTGSGWQRSETWLRTSGTSDWSYDTSAQGISSDDVFTVSVRATDEAGQTRSYTSGPPTPDANTLRVDYTVDTTKPSISGVTVTEKNGDDTVEVGDTVRVSATVTDATAGVDTVTTDASALGGPDSLSLSHVSGDTYFDSFTVSEPPASDGSVPLTVTASDYFGSTRSDTDSVTLETTVDSVDSLQVHSEFLGIVEDTNTSIRVTADGVRDAQGNLVASGGAATETATVEIAGTSYIVDVDGGTVDARIDPTRITDDVNTGSTTVAIDEANAQSDTDTITLVHEARGLDEGYQVEGTPMDTTDVVFQNVSDVTTYDPTATNTKWVSPAENQAGEGYYVHGNDSSARIGYTYKETGRLHSRYLHEGYNLVAATPDLNSDSTVAVGDDLGEGVTVSDSDITVYVRDNSEGLTDPSGDADVSAFTTASGSESLSAYEGYFVYVASNEEIRTVDKEGYDPSEGS